MKKNTTFAFVGLLALALTFGLTGCPEEEKTPAAVGTATVASGIVNGTVSTALSSKSFEITLSGNKFKAIEVTADLKAWITNLPAGLAVAPSVAVAADETKVTLVVSGTPTEPSTAALAIKIPASALKEGGDLTVTSNAGAKFAIVTAAALAAATAEATKISGATAAAPTASSNGLNAEFTLTPTSSGNVEDAATFAITSVTIGTGTPITGTNLSGFDLAPVASANTAKLTIPVKSLVEAAATGDVEIKFVATLAGAVASEATLTIVSGTAFLPAITALRTDASTLKNNSSIDLRSTFGGAAATPGIGSITLTANTTTQIKGGADGSTGLGLVVSTGTTLGTNGKTSTGTSVTGTDADDIKGANFTLSLAGTPAVEISIADSGYVVSVSKVGIVKFSDVSIINGDFEYVLPDFSVGVDTARAN
ncbi:hypothetical protein FACS1894172_18460 [Spirochaetia bacterium]|nr:hypothetical protein FACS1894172_18460 [Spirochaetia bacterium]